MNNKRELSWTTIYRREKAAFVIKGQPTEATTIQKNPCTSYEIRGLLL
ncbi:hypothetical protein [Prevotella sp. OH937_COT-195]|nr:hypothetical protein [Prevotella sp. OH937_COT-195]